MTSRGLTRVARYISAVFNAPFAAAFTFGSLAIASGALDWPTVFSIALTFATAIPVASIYVLTWKGVIPDVYASERGSRTYPFLLAVISYAAGFSLLVFVGAPAIVSALMLCYMVNTVLVTLITLVWKISIHTSGIAGPAAALGTAFGPLGFLFLVLVIPVGWARVELKSHPLLQVGAGAALALLLTFVELQVYLPRL